MRSVRPRRAATLLALLTLLVGACESGGGSDPAAGAGPSAPLPDPAFTRLGEGSTNPIISAAGTEVIVSGGTEPAGDGTVRQRRDIVVIDTATNVQTEVAVPETEVPTEFGQAVGTETGLLLMAHPCPEGIERPDIDNVGCGRPSTTSYLSSDSGRTWSEAPLPPNASPPDGQSSWQFGGELVAVPDGRAAITYTAAPAGTHPATTQLAIFDDGRWSRAYETGAGRGTTCASSSELFVHDRSRPGEPAVLWTIRLDDRTATRVDAPVHPLDIAPAAQLACDRSGAALVSVGADFSSSMAVHRLRAGRWVTDEIADSVASVPNQVMSSGGAGIVVESYDEVGDRSERRVRLITAGTGATTVVRLSTRVWHIVPGLSGDRVALLGPFGPPEKTAPARVRIEEFP